MVNIIYLQNFMHNIAKGEKIQSLNQNIRLHQIKHLNMIMKHQPPPLKIQLFSLKKNTLVLIKHLKSHTKPIIN